MTTTQVVKTSDTVTNSSFQNYTHPDDPSRQTTDTPGFKPFTMLQIIFFTDFLYQSSFTVNLHHAYRPAFANLSFQLPTLERNG